MHFVNELGNKITLKIKKQKDTGYSPSGVKHRFDAVNIKLSGPESEAEWVITYREAAEIHKGLTQFFLAQTKK